MVTESFGCEVDGAAEPLPARSLLCGYALAVKPLPSRLFAVIPFGRDGLDPRPDL